MPIITEGCYKEGGFSFATGAQHGDGTGTIVDPVVSIRLRSLSKG
jgi:hypothetical protein